MKNEKNKNEKDKEKIKFKYNLAIKGKFHEKNPSEKLEMNLCYPIKINAKYFNKKLNNIKSTTPKKEISIFQKQSNTSKDKIFFNNFTISEKVKKYDNKSIKNCLNKMDNRNNSSSDDINNINKDEQIEKNYKDNSLEDNIDFYKKKKGQLQNKIKQSTIPNKNSNNYITPNNLNQIYTNEQYNNDLFSNLFIDNSSDNKNILVSELDIELSNMDQNNCNKKNDKIEERNLNVIEDEEDTNQKSNEHINVYKKIELRFKSKLEKSLNKYFKKNGTNFYIGNRSNNNNQIPKEVENQNKSKSNKNVQNNIENKNNIKKLINSDGKMSHNINFTINLRESYKNKKEINRNSKLKLVKSKLKESETIKKFQKIISYKTTKFKISDNKNKKHIITNNNLINKKNYDKKDMSGINKDNSTKNSYKKKKNSPSNTFIDKKIKAIYSKIINDANIIKENKNQIIEKDINKNNAKNNSTCVRQSYKFNPYYMHSINSIKSKKNNNNIIKYDAYNFRYNQLHHHKIKNNIFKGEISIKSSYNNTKRKNLDDINININNLNKNNISYVNSKSVKNKNKLNKFFPFINMEGNSTTQIPNYKNKIITNKSIDFQNKKNDLHKKEYKSYNYKIRTKPHKGLNTEINNFKTIKYFVNKGINKKIELSNRKINKINNNNDLIIKKNMKNKVKSEVWVYDNNEKSGFFYNKILFLCYSPYKNSNLMQHNSFKKKLESNI